MSPRPRVASATAPRRPGRPRGPSQANRLRQRLIAEASALYAEGGYAGVNLSTVAERAGLTKATVFHYFDNKEALVYAVFIALGERLEQGASNWFDATPKSHATRLERLIDSLVDFYGADPLNARILCQALLERGRLAPQPNAEGELPPVFAHFVARFVEFVESGIRAGEFYPDRPIALIMAIGGIILFEFMLPEHARRLSGSVPLVERKREMSTVIARAIVRPTTRMSRRGKASGRRRE
jgi:TetR/AcrR family transcriptional regulator